MVTARELTPTPPPAAKPPSEVVYPESDGKPMAENTKQWDWIVLLKTNLDAVVPDFVGSDNFWYPVEGRPDIVTAPDVYVAIGRPKGHRPSYKQWVEGGVAPAVVFEVLSPGNSMREMMRKAAFYARHGAREMIVVDPDDETGHALLMDDEAIAEEVRSLDGWTSPTLGIRFAREGDHLVVYRPDGSRFRSPAELEADERAARAEAEASRAEAEAARAQAARLAEKLRALGLDPDAL